MKRIMTFLGAFMFVSILLTSCGESTKKGGNEVKVEIPEELSKNQKVTEYFNTLEEVIDEYVTMIEKLAESSKKAESGDEPSFYDAMNMVGDVTSSTLKMAPLLEKMEKLEQDGEILKEEMSPEEIEAFSKTYAKIMTRFYEASQKIESK